MATDIFICSHNPVSGRLAILDDNERVAFLYLTQRGTQKPEKDAIAYMRLTPPETVDSKQMAKEGEAPLLSSEFATVEAVIANPSEKDFSFQWSSTGEAAVLLYKNLPIALVSASEKRGYSRSVSKENPLANPWNSRLYASLFGN